VSTSAETTPSDDPAPPARGSRRPPVGPAAAVLGVAVLIVVLGSVVALIGTGSARNGGTALGSVVPGVGLRSVPAAPFLRQVAEPGEPPSDVVTDLRVPAGTRYEGSRKADKGVDQFNRSVTLAVPAASRQVERFYLKELARAHWKLQYDGKTDGGIELLAQQNGNDGYAWGVAVQVTSVDPTLTPALAGGSDSASSKVVMTVYQVEDAS
jgi:hypothetical protein